MLVNPQDYIGKITTSRIPFYDNKSGEMKMKKRPVLIIGAEKNTFPCDFNVLPVSTITHKEHRNSLFDYEIEKTQCEIMNLKKSPSFIRIHKQSTCHSMNVDKRYYCDVLYDHNDIYIKIIDLHNKYNETLF